MGDEARQAVGEYQFGFHDPEHATIRFDKGLSEQVVRDISALKNEPEWMTELRVKAYHHFMERPMPEWGNAAMLKQIDFDAVTYFLRSSDKTERNWDDVPDDIKHTFERLGIPEAEQKWLGGVTAQYESEAVYHSMREDLEAQGVIFLDLASENIPTSSRNSSTRSSPTPTTNSAPSTPPSGPGAPSSTSRRACTLRCPFRPTSASTRRTWGSLSAP